MARTESAVARAVASPRNDEGGRYCLSTADVVAIACLISTLAGRVGRCLMCCGAAVLARQQVGRV